MHRQASSACTAAAKARAWGSSEKFTQAVIQGVRRGACANAAAMVLKLLVVCGPESPELEVLRRKLPKDRVEVVAVAQHADDFQLLPEQWSSVDVLLACGILPNQAKRQDLQALWPKLTNLKWMHTTFAGLEHLLFPELVQSPVVLTNARGVYSHSLAEFALLAAKWFAMDVPRLLRAKRERRWDQFEVEELRGKVMGIVGLGDIGLACARLAKAYHMKVLGLRRNTAATEEESAMLDHGIFSPEQIVDMVARCDYVVVATPHTPGTHKLVSAAAIQAMQPHCVFINVGRGECVDEAALTAALREGRLRGAGLDVFYEEPLPVDSPFWDMENVFMSPHCADRTKEFQFETMELFLANMQRYLHGADLLNVCNKQAGY